MGRIRSFLTAFFTRYKRENRSQQRGRFFDALSVKKRTLDSPWNPWSFFLSNNIRNACILLFAALFAASEYPHNTFLRIQIPARHMQADQR